MKITILLMLCNVFLALGDDPAKTLNIAEILRTQVEKDAQLLGKLGYSKLSQAEQDAWFSLLEQAYLAGVEHGKAGKTTGAAVSRGQKSEIPAKTAVAYLTKVDSDSDDLTRLENGAIVEITSGFLGFVGIRKTAALIKEGQVWSLWIEGKRLYRCNLIRGPQFGRARKVRRVSIGEVKASGKILVLSDGSMLEVDDIDTVYTSIWLGGSEALILDDFQLLNLGESDEPVGVMPLR